MRYVIIALVLVLAGSASYAGGIMLLHVGTADGSGAPAVNCGTGVIDLTTGCPQPMLR